MRMNGRIKVEITLFLSLAMCGYLVEVKGDDERRGEIDEAQSRAGHLLISNCKTQFV